ncbi:Retrovirus-related Pol polyprotein from transposon RE1, partial [Bienertia sinuspersici]
MEIILASKRKLGFVTGAVKKDTSDSKKADQFGTCNSMVIAWILANVSESIKRSILFVYSAREIWKQLQSRFSQTSGSRKYQLNKEVFEVKQQGRSVSDYYTAMKALWEEIDGLTMLPAITDEEEVSAMFSSESETGCSVYGRKKHTTDKCWKVIGYPRWHPEYKKQQRNKRRGEGSSGEKGGKPKGGHKEGRKIAGSAQNKDDSISLTAQQLDQLLKLLPSSSRARETRGETDDEIDEGFAGMSLCSNAHTNRDWRIDSGSSNHMISCADKMQNMSPVKGKPPITLPNWKTANISHVGDVSMNSKLKLKNVLLVPKFRHNLLSVNQLIQDGKCQIIFHADYCVISEKEIGKIKGVGKAKNGVYYLQNHEHFKEESKIAKKETHLS